LKNGAAIWHARERTWDTELVIAADKRTLEVVTATEETTLSSNAETQMQIFEFPSGNVIINCTNAHNPDNKRMAIERMREIRRFPTGASGKGGQSLLALQKLREISFPLDEKDQDEEEEEEERPITCRNALLRASPRTVKRPLEGDLEEDKEKEEENGSHMDDIKAI